MQRLFTDMAWSSDDVYEVTRRRIEEIGLSVTALPTREDVDTLNELEKLRQALCQPEIDAGSALARLRDEIDAVMNCIDNSSGDAVGEEDR